MTNSELMLNFWLGFLNGVVDILMAEPILYMYGLYVAFLVLTFLRKLLHTRI